MLDDRKSAILRAVVQKYIETAQPVGSSHVVDSNAVEVSAATVRNEMTTLEREGYLVQPHTSAGRIPTEKGYRFFVDALGGDVELGPSQIRQVRSFFAHAHGELEQMLRNTSRLLADVTATTAVVVHEAADTAVVRSVQLVGLTSRTVLAVVVLSNGVVIKATVEGSDEVDDDQVAASQRIVAAAITGAGTGALGRTEPSGDPAVDQLSAAALAAIADVLQREGARLFVDGASRIAGAFDAADTLREVLGLLEQQLSVVSLLHDVVDRGLTVAIGSETGVANLSECSVVVAPFTVSGEHAGTIGVLGPTRMNYPETLAAVALVSQRLSRSLTEGG